MTLLYVTAGVGIVLVVGAIVAVAVAVFDLRTPRIKRKGGRRG